MKWSAIQQIIFPLSWMVRPFPTYIPSLPLFFVLPKILDLCFAVH